MVPAYDTNKRIQERNLIRLIRFLVNKFWKKLIDYVKKQLKGGGGGKQ